MAKQIYNTRGRTLESLKDSLKNIKEHTLSYFQYNMEKLKQQMANEEQGLLEANKQIEYLEKFIARKEKK